MSPPMFVREGDPGVMLVVNMNEGAFRARKGRVHSTRTRLESKY